MDPRDIIEAKYAEQLAKDPDFADAVGKTNEYGWETGKTDGPILTFLRENDKERYATHRREVFAWLVKGHFFTGHCDAIKEDVLERLWQEHLKEEHRDG